jgi:hypothetical protein
VAMASSRREEPGRGTGRGTFPAVVMPQAVTLPSHILLFQRDHPPLGVYKQPASRESPRARPRSAALASGSGEWSIQDRLHRAKSVFNLIGPISDDRAGLGTAVHHAADHHDVVRP